uniref:Gamma-soluble NSF attachment protein n=1 Tax=Hucho hucho TaxID=62062 RepID=A0A4W5KL77_9TELE
MTSYRTTWLNKGYIYIYFKPLKTSMTKWKPDFDSAASEYAKAAVCFKNAKQFEQAKDAYLKEAEYHTENKALFHAAKAIEQAGMMMKDLKKMPEAIQYIEKASMMYVENGTPDTAAMALDRAGKLDEAATALQKEKNMYKDIENYPTCFKKTTAQVLVHLHRNDFVAADKCVRESYSLPGYSGSEDCVAMETLLQGYDEQDEDQVHRVCNSALLKYMDNDVSNTVPPRGLFWHGPSGGAQLNIRKMFQMFAMGH